MIISFRTIFLLAFLAFLAGLLALAPLALWLQGILNGISQATAPVANAIRATSDNSLCHATKIIGC